MKTESVNSKRRPAPGLGHYLGNEEGMMLVLTMVILLVISSLAASNLINSYLERSIARNQHFSTVSLNAAEAGLAFGLTKLNTDLVNGSGTFQPADPATTPNWTASTNGSVGDGDFTVTASFLKEDIDGDGVCEAGDDRDGDGTTCEVVYYNNYGSGVGECQPGDDNCFGYPDALFLTPPPGPFPVVQLLSVGSYGGASTRTLTLEVARNPLDIKAYGAITGSSNINLTGNVNVSGSAHDENGSPCTNCSCNDAFPGVTISSGHNATCAGSCTNAGEDEFGNPQPVDNANTYGIPPLTPDEALGLPEGSLVSMVGTPVGDLTDPKTSADGSIKWYNKDYTLNPSSPASDKTGVLIIHNPLFVSRDWNVSDPASPNYNPPDAVACATFGVTGNWSHHDGNYDEKLDTNDPCGGLYDASYRTDAAPRAMDQNGVTTFKGVIIADQISQINGTADIYGAVISLTTVDVNVNSNGAANIYYSCDAINLYTAQSFSHKLSWHRRF